MAEKPEPALALLKALIHCIDLRCTQFRIRNGEAILRLDQLRKAFNGGSHSSPPCIAG